MENNSAQTRLLQLPELLLSIFSYEDRRTLPILARVCKLFREVALDLTWREPPTLEVLLPIVQSESPVSDESKIDENVSLCCHKFLLHF
jgi:hypothetical protein